MNRLLLVRDSDRRLVGIDRFSALILPLVDLGAYTGSSDEGGNGKSKGNSFHGHPVLKEHAV